ncbi:MAG TPA: VanZ family protein [Terriglobales bacterium]
MIAWVPAVLWIGVIALESTDWFSAEHTGRFLYPILHFLFSISTEVFDIWHHILRKTGHFIGYFALSALLFRAWRATLRAGEGKVWAMRWALPAFFMSVVVASMDEWHQTYLPSRTGRLADVLLDSMGALTAQIVIFLILSLRQSRQAAEA